MENTKYGRRREGRWTPIRAKAQDTRANLNSWETHLVRKRWDIGLLRALSLRIMMKVIIFIHSFIQTISIAPLQVHFYSEALPTQQGYFAGVSRRSATNIVLSFLSHLFLKLWSADKEIYFKDIGLWRRSAGAF